MTEGFKGEIKRLVHQMPRISYQSVQAWKFMSKFIFKKTLFCIYLL